ncbi:hypothetical protein ACIPSE_33225 [Streptomyces sp. NPDC090106]|uniref:hypothetical protein n=1 Tax=Streptomyces sp. NPDC090106 TaxID=3365946 RepID=UPI003816A3A0
MGKTAAPSTLLGLAVLASLLGGTACSTGDGPAPHRSSPPVPATTATASAGPGGPGATASVPGAVLPGALVGSWRSIEEKNDTATIAYRFTSDGRYKYAGLVTQPIPEGIFKITFIAEGTARAEGRNLLLRPLTATRSREDPRSPQDDYTDQPSSLDPEQYVWGVSDGTLSLTGSNGNTVTYERVPQ